MSEITLKAMNIRQDTSEGKFYINIKGQEEAYLAYELLTDRKTNVVNFTELHIPETLQSIGIENKMAMEAVRFAEKSGFKVKASCPFMQGWLNRHPEFDFMRVK